ncbi:MAG: MFS transporter, partial [Rhodospirillales bacterium]|nr:MFS transporter [Rhodospirillales bacterium]
MAHSGEPPAAAGDIDGYPLLTRAAMLAVATVGATIFAISPLLPDIAQSFAIEPGQAGMLLTVYSIVLALAAPIVGLTAKQLPRSRVIVGGLVVFALAWLGAGQAQRFEVLLALGALAGAATGTVLPAAYALAGDLSSFEQRGRAVGRIVSGWSIAILLVVPTMAFAAQIIDWRSAFAGLALAALGCALAIALAPRPPQAAPAGPLVLAALVADLRAVLSE